MDTETQIIIADDHPIFRRGLSAVIDAETEFTVVAAAENLSTDTRDIVTRTLA